MINLSIELRKIRSVKSLSQGRKSRKSLPKAFEIFMDDEVSYILKVQKLTILYNKFLRQMIESKRKNGFNVFKLQ